MGSLVTYEHDGSVATITMDDGKVNALSLTMLTEVRAAFEQASGDGAVVVLAGREGRFSGGFDLGVLNAGGPDAVAMLRSGFELAERVLSFPTPVVMACTGHTVAMGVFLLLSGDSIVGADGPFKITANEVAIGLTLPWAAIEILRNRLTPAHFARAADLAEVYSPEAAVAAGFLDHVVAPDQVHAVAHETATAFTQLDMAAHVATKLRVREPALRTLRAAIDDEFGSQEGRARVARTKLRTPELRDRVLQVAVDTLADAGVTGFTTRRVASGASTSLPAVYELFGDKAGLVREVFFEGFRRLGAGLDELPVTDDPRTDLLAVLAVYRRFLLANPELADVMFSRPFADFDPGPDEARAGSAVRELVVGRVRRAVDAGVLAGDATDIAHVLVALAQGLAAQEAAGWLGTSAASIERRWALAADAVLAGLAAAAR